MVEETAAFGGEAAIHHGFRLNCGDGVGKIADDAAGVGKARQDLARHLAIAADDEKRPDDAGR